MSSWWGYLWRSPLARQTWEAAIWSNTWHNQHEGLRGISNPMKGADWHFPLVEKERDKPRTTLWLASRPASNCYLRWKIWFASKNWRQTGCVCLILQKLRPSPRSQKKKTEARLHTLQSYFVIRWFAWGEHKSAWLDGKHESKVARQSQTSYMGTFLPTESTACGWIRVKVSTQVHPHLTEAFFFSPLPAVSLRQRLYV